MLRSVATVIAAQIGTQTAVGAARRAGLIRGAHAVAARIETCTAVARARRASLINITDTVTTRDARRPDTRVVALA